MTPTREQILGASAGWVAVLLNVLPGLGAGYLYQRRWKAYWITSSLATGWFVAGAALGQNADTGGASQNQLVGLAADDGPMARASDASSGVTPCCGTRRHLPGWVARVEGRCTRS